MPPVAKHVVDQEDAAARTEGVGVHLQLVRTVLELVFECDGGVRELSRFADRHESGIHLQGQGCAKDEAPRLGRGDHVDTLSGECCLEAGDGRARTLRGGSRAA